MGDALDDELVDAVRVRGRRGGLAGRRLTRRLARLPRLTEEVAALTQRAESDRQSHELNLYLARTNQVLLRRQLHLLDTMERRENDPEDLADLFRVDHLATRLRRNVEKTIIAAGAVPARRWRRPVPLVDVVRGAVAEVEDYQRVLVSPSWVGSLSGPAVPDLIHLLAELVENALSFSEPNTSVQVSMEHRSDDRIIVILDDGPGLNAAALVEANALLRDPPRLCPAGAGRGLYGVAQTAQRWGVAVELAASRRGGTAARVLIPAGLIVDAQGGPADPEGPSGASDPGGRCGAAESTGAPDSAATATQELPLVADTTDQVVGRPPAPERSRPG